LKTIGNFLGNHLAPGTLEYGGAFETQSGTQPRRCIQGTLLSSVASEAFRVRSARWALPVFFLSGLLMSFPGAILPAWGYHVRDAYATVGHYFLAMALGILLSSKGPPGIRSGEVRTAIVAGCGLASVALLGLALSGPPQEWGWRAGGLGLLGLSAGILNSAAFQSISSLYEQDPAATVNLAGVLFGLGCLTTALFVSLTFYVYTVGSMLVLLAVIPGFAAVLYGRSQLAAPVQHSGQTWKQIWNDVRSPGAVMFTMVLFFQSGNEWTVAGWLAVFLA
jgi:hypothetical protein